MSTTKFKELKEIAARFMAFGKKEEPAPAKAHENFVAAKTKGSQSTLEYDPDLTVGSDVMQSSGTGSIAAADGSYDLENGVSFSVEGGKLKSVENDGKQPDPDGDKTADEKMEAVLLEFATVKEELAAVKTELKTANDFIATMPTAEAIVKFNEDMHLFGEAIKELSEMTFETVVTSTDPEVKGAQKIDFAAVAGKFAGEQVTE